VVTVDQRAEATVLDPKPGDRQTGRSVAPAALLAGAALLLGAAGAYIAFATEAPGASLAAVCTLMAGIGALMALGGWLLLRRRNRLAARTFPACMAVVTAGVVWWSWAFAMPAAMSLDRGATRDALAALAATSATSGTGKQICVTVEHGSIGPLDAPYSRCAWSGAPVPTVTYFAKARTPRGLVFMPHGTVCDIGEPSVRHLVGSWYAFTGSPTGTLGYTPTHCY
jgi:hypothetical protein